MTEKIKKQSKIRQHYIPQFYLRNFGDNLCCFDKKEERKFNSTPENIAVKSDFYGGEYEGLPSLEKMFSQIENIHSIAIKKLLEVKDYYKLAHDGKVSICEFFALQFLRTESQRNEIIHIFEEAINFAAGKVIPKEVKVTLSKQGKIKQHLNMIKEYKRFAILFFNMKFITQENHTAIPFWTSDNPITKQNEYDKHALGNLGVINKGIEIHLPISPKISIWAVDPILFMHNPTVYDIYKKQHVIRENFLQLNFSSRFVYSNTNRFHLIKSMLKDNMHLKDETDRKTQILTAESDKGSIFMISERNDRWPATNEVMGKMETWMKPEIANKIIGVDKKED